MEENKIELLEEKSRGKEKLNIKLDNFEGPLDLLCYLIYKKKLDITEIKILDIAKEYLDMINTYEKYNMEISSDFIEMAAKLVYIKSKEVLPKENDEEINEEEELINKIIEYKKYKENLPSFINAYEENQGRILKPAEKMEIKREFNKIYNIKDLSASYKQFVENLKNRKNENSKNVERLAVREKFSVKKKVKEILDKLKINTKIIFNKVFSVKEKPKGEVIAAFLGSLELSKKEEIKLIQKNNFEEITILKNKDKMK